MSDYVNEKTNFCLGQNYSFESVRSTHYGSYLMSVQLRDVTATYVGLRQREAILWANIPAQRVHLFMQRREGVLHGFELPESKRFHYESDGGDDEPCYSVLSVSHLGKVEQSGELATLGKLLDWLNIADVSGIVARVKTKAA